MELEDEDGTVPLARVLEKLVPNHTTVFDVAESGKKLTVEVRRLNPEAPPTPLKAESPRRAHVFHDVEGFGQYLGRYGGANTVVLADVPNARVAAVLDEMASDGFQVLTFEPQVHPLWAPWAAMIGTQLELEEFVEFLLHNRRALQGSRELIMSLSQVKASTKVELNRGRGKTALNGLMVKVEIQGTMKDELVELPDSITVYAPIFVATQTRAMALDLTIAGANNGTGIVCSLASGDLLAAKIEAFEEMLETLREQALPGVIAFGQPKHDGWTYLKPTA